MRIETDKADRSNATKIPVLSEMDGFSALLERTPAALDALLRGLPATLIARDEGVGTWTVRDVVAHLVEGERVDWLPRVKHLLAYGESRPFPPFDRNGFAESQRGEPLEQLLDEFKVVRGDRLRELRALDIRGDDLTRRGLHPQLGAVTLSQLLSTWAAHDMTHLHQISRIVARQMEEAVGPWKSFLGVLQCNGHSKSA